jgi:hypothetical protein
MTDEKISSLGRKEHVNTLLQCLDKIEPIVSSMGLAFEHKEDKVRGIKVLEHDEWIDVTNIRDSIVNLLTKIEKNGIV